MLPEPIDDPFKGSWNKIKEKLCSAYARILANNRKRKTPGDSVFFDPVEDQIFAQYRKLVTEKDLDFDCSNLNLDESDFDSESDSEPDQKKIGAPRKIIEIGKTRKENRNFRARSQKLRDLIVSFCEEEKLKVGPCTAKIASMILHDTSSEHYPKHYDLKSAKIFNKIAKGEDVSKG